MTSAEAGRPLQGGVSGRPPEAATTLPSDDRDREPRGFGPRYFVASVGLFLAIFAPVLGGLSVKVQSLVGLAAAPALLGIISGVGALFALVAQPLAGRLSDRTTSRFGMRRPWIVLGVVGVALSLVGIALAPSVGLLLVAFAAAQLFSNFAQATETVTIADQVPVPRRGFISGLVGAASPIAILIAAVGLNFLPGLELKFIVPAVISLVLGLWFALTLRDRVLEGKPARFDVKEFFGSFVFNPRTHRSFGWAWLTKFLIFFGYAATTTYLTLYVAQDFGMKDPADQLQFNLYATIVSTVFIVGASLLGGRLSDRLRRRKAFVMFGGAVLGFGVIVLGLAPALGIAGGLILILVSEAFIGTGLGVFLAVDTALAIEVLPDAENTAKDLGVLNIANTLPQTIAPLLAGTLVIPLVNQAFGGIGYSVWFVFAGLVSIVGAFLVQRIQGVR